MCMCVCVCVCVHACVASAPRRNTNQTDNSQLVISQVVCSRQQHNKAAHGCWNSCMAWSTSSKRWALISGCSYMVCLNAIRPVDEWAPSCKHYSLHQMLQLVSRIGAVREGTKEQDTRVRPVNIFVPKHITSTAECQNKF